MRRLLFSCSLLLLAGIYLGYFLPSDAVTIVLIIAIASGIIKATKTRGAYLKVAACFLSFSLILGIFLIPISEHSQCNGFKAGELHTLKLRVAAEPEIRDDYFSYICDIEEIEDDGVFHRAEGKIKLSYSEVENPLSFGDLFIASVEITEPSSPKNRGDFNYGLHLKTKNIFNTAKINGNIHKISENNFTLKDRFTLLNIKLCKNIDENFNENGAMFLKSVLLGEKSDMTQDFYSELKRSGLSHIAAVSGMHLSYLVLLLSAFSRLFKVGKRAFSVFIIFFSLCFMLLTGLSPSAVRATIMIVCLYSGSLLFRRSDPLTSLGLAILIITIANPYVAFNSSFLLSFGATAGILLISAPLEKLLTPQSLSLSKNWLSKILRYVISLVAISLSAQLLTVPFVLGLFGEMSLWAIPANIVIAPLLPILLGAGFLFCIFSIICTPFCVYISKILTLIIDAAKHIISFFGNLDFGIIQFLSTEPLFIFAYVVLLVIIFLFLLKRRQFLIYPLAMLLVAIIFMAVQCVNSQNSAQVRFINVGQGDSALISLPEDVNILIDGGPSYSKEIDSSSAASSYLTQNGVNHIDFMIATHANSDHTGGLLSILNECEVDTLIIPPTFYSGSSGEMLLQKAAEKDVQIRILTTGNSISFSRDISITALLPDNHLSSNEISQNNGSLVIKLDCFNTSFLFTGDIEATAEHYMIRLLPEEVLDADVLKVPHHGSGFSSTEEFIKAVSPDFAVISSDGQSFGHPSQEVLTRLSSMGATIFRTDLNKDIIFVLTSDGISNIIYN